MDSRSPSADAAPAVLVDHAADLIDLLLTVGFIDGVFHPREQAFARNYLDTAVLLSEQMGGLSAEQQARIRATSVAQIDELYRQLAGEVAQINGEVRATGETSFVLPRLAVRALTVFRRLPVVEQPGALELIRAMMRADGVITDAETRLYDELAAALAKATPPPQPSRITAAPGVVTRPALQVLPPHWNPLKAMGHALLDPLEHTYSPHPVELQSQLAYDYQVIGNAINQWHRLRAHGHGRLAGISDIGQLPVGARFLDGHVHVHRPDQPTELVVLGDLHGCYACFKAALLQSDFINRVWAHQWDPRTYPDVKLVLLGDYIDRGLFSFDGVMRAVLHLFCAMPDNVIVLRGNHEYYKSRNGMVFSGVYPAEGLHSILRHAPVALLEAYKDLFDQLPTSFLFERTLFVHGGIPRDDTFAERYRDLSSLEDPDVRFQMLWSDPVQTDHVPVELQRKSSRFNFGREQFRAFMTRIGCHTMIRGHEQIEAGFEVIYDLGDRQLLNLFSAGGADNRDLPLDSSYRRVVPMALTIVADAAGQRAVPWPIEYQPFNYPVHNGLYRPQPLLEYRNT